MKSVIQRNDNSSLVTSCEERALFMEDRGLWQLQLRQLKARSPCGTMSTKELVPVSSYGPTKYHEQGSRRWKDEMKVHRERLQVYLIAEEKKALRLLQMQEPGGLHSERREVNSYESFAYSNWNLLVCILTGECCTSMGGSHGRTCCNAAGHLPTMPSCIQL